MIELHVDDYCHACPEFDAEVNTTRLYRDNMVYDGDTIIMCKNESRCHAIKRYLEGVNKNDSR